MADQQVHMRLWRGDASGGEFKDYRIAVGEGQVVLDVVHAIQAQTGERLSRALELQSRQMWFVQRRS